MLYSFPIVLIIIALTFLLRNRANQPTGPSDRTATDGFLVLMRNRNYSLLWLGQLVSELGNRFHWVAVSLWFYSLTHSATNVALAISSMHVGGLIVGLWAGVVVDRLNRKSILITSDLVRAILVAIIPKLMLVSMWLVYADLVVVSMATAFFRPAMFSIIPQIVHKRHLLSANSFFSAMDTGTEIVGPALAGILAGVYGYSSLLYVDAATYSVSALCILGMVIPVLVPRFEGRLDFGTIWTGMKEGLHYIRKDRLQWALFVLIFPAYLASSGLNGLLAPLSKGIIGITDAEFGTFNSILGVGFVIASFLLALSGAKLGKSLIILGGYFVMFAATAFMGLSTSFRTLLLAGFTFGFANTFYYIGILTMLMEYTPQDVIGRVISFRQFALRTVNIVSPIFFGVIADVIGVRQAIVAMALTSAAGTGVLVALNPALRNLDKEGREVQDRAGERPKGSIGDRMFDFWRFITGSVVSVYQEGEQRLLSAISILVVALGWIVLLYRQLAPGLFLTWVVVTMAILGSLARRLGFLSMDQWQSRKPGDPASEKKGLQGHRRK